MQWRVARRHPLAGWPGPQRHAQDGGRLPAQWPEHRRAIIAPGPVCAGCASRAPSAAPWHSLRLACPLRLRFKFAARAILNVARAGGSAAGSPALELSKNARNCESDTGMRQTSPPVLAETSGPGFIPAPRIALLHYLHYGRVQVERLEHHLK